MINQTILNKLIASQNEVCVGPFSCVKGMVCGDIFNARHGGVNRHYLAPLGGNLGVIGVGILRDRELPSQSIIRNSWWHRVGDKQGIIENSGRFYGGKGLRFIASVADKKEAIHDWIQEYSPDEVLGVNATIWHETQPNLVSEVGCVGWNISCYDSRLIRPRQ